MQLFTSILLKTIKNENSSSNYRKVPQIFLKIPIKNKNGRGYNSFEGYIGALF